METVPACSSTARQSRESTTAMGWHLILCHGTSLSKFMVVSDAQNCCCLGYFRHPCTCDQPVPPVPRMLFALGPLSGTWIPRYLLIWLQSPEKQQQHLKGSRKKGWLPWCPCQGPSMSLLGQLAPGPLPRAPRPSPPHPPPPCQAKVAPQIPCQPAGT